MTGHVRKRGKSWTVIYDEGHDEDGKRVQRWKGGFATRKAAQVFLAETLSDLGDGSYVQPSKTLLGDYLAEWLEGLGDELAPLTRSTYSAVVRTHICSRPWLARKSLQAVTGADVRRLESEQQGSSAATRTLTRAVLSRALTDAVAIGKLMRNPAAQIKRRGRRAQANGTEPNAKAWTTRELARFLEHVDDDRLYALWRLGAMTGMRRGELLGLKWERLDLDGARLAVEEQLLPTRGGVTFGPPKSTRSRRKVALDTETVETLRAHRETQLLERALAGDAYVDQDLVFADELGRPIQPERLTQAFRRHRKAAGIPVGTLHTLRHTHATDLLSNGVPVHVAAARIGDRAETILKVYAHLLPQSDEQAARDAAARISLAR